MDIATIENCLEQLQNAVNELDAYYQDGVRFNSAERKTMQILSEHLKDFAAFVGEPIE